MSCNISALRSASQIALLGAVTSNLRAVNIIQKERIILMKFYYEKISEDEEDIPEIVAAEMFSYFEDEYEIKVQTVVLSLNFPIPQEGIRVFSRKY